MKALFVLGVTGAALLVGTLTRAVPRPAPHGDLMPEVIVTAEAPLMLMDEVVVRPGGHRDAPGDGMPDSAALSRPSDGIPN